MNAKIAVINVSGNVGKSTLSKHLLSPRLNCEVLPIETINADGSEQMMLNGKQFDMMMDLMSLQNSMIVDVGSSNVEEFLQQMKNYSGSHEDFDLYVIPTVPDKKQQRDTIKTITLLHTLGVESQRIRVLFNMVESKMDVKSTFEGIFDLMRMYPALRISEALVIHENDLFDKLHKADATIDSVLQDTTDFKELIAITDDKEEKLQLSRRLAIKRLASGVKNEFDQVFATLIGK